MNIRTIHALRMLLVLCAVQNAFAGTDDKLTITETQRAITVSGFSPGSTAGEVVVSETYRYATSSGRISKRDALDESHNGSRTTLQTFTQNATYDQLGSISKAFEPLASGEGRSSCCCRCNRRQGGQHTASLRDEPPRRSLL